MSGCSAHVVEEAHHHLSECLVDRVAPAQTRMIGDGEAAPPTVLLENRNIVVVIARARTHLSPTATGDHMC
jgi:hypothetical protein